MKTPRAGLVGSALLAVVLGCGGDASDDGDPASESPSPSTAAAVTMPTVTIVTPAEGSTLEGSDAVVTLTVEGIEVAPIAEGRMDTGHHHLYLDVDLTPLELMVPLDNPQIIHMGDGRSTHTFEGLAPGEHRVIAVLADPTHTPIDPPVVDTVTFRVSG
jgi:hypothetical protein